MSNQHAIANDLYFACATSLGMSIEDAQELLDEEVTRFGLLDGLMSAKRRLARRELNRPKVGSLQQSTARASPGKDAETTEH